MVKKERGKLMKDYTVNFKINYAAKYLSEVLAP